MEMSLRLVVVATIALLASTILIFMFTGQVGDFGGFLDSQSNQSQCDLWLERGTCGKHTECGWERGDCIESGGEVESCDGLDEEACRDADKCSWGKADDRTPECY